MSTKLIQKYSYLRLKVVHLSNIDSTKDDEPVDAVTLRKSLQEALTQTFGLSGSGTYIDVLWTGSSEAVVRVDSK
jgi:hypothetical protein